MNSLSHLVVDYAPSLFDEQKPASVRMDGHYANRADAELIAKDWANNSTFSGARVVEIHPLNRVCGR